ncbi:MAG TPA: Holliday junction resolvase RuvX [Clostridia bacterium]|nr:Holliday junction resolvase RuvX [Clostridia bacterium]
MKQMRILGMDLGEKRIGLSLSDPLGITAQGLKTIKRTDLETDLQQLKEIIEEKKVKKIVVGLPRNMDGTLGPQAEKVKQFIAFLIQEISMEVVYWDERLTTIAAERVLIGGGVSRKKRKKFIDKLAAVIILQSFLDNSR